MFKKTLLLSLLLLSNLALATSGKAVAKSTDSKGEDAPKSWGVSISGTFNSSIDAPDAYYHSVSSQIGLSGFYKLPAEFTLGANFGFAKQLDGLLEESLSNGFVSLSRPLVKFTDAVTLSARTRIFIPMNHDAIELDTFRTAMDLSTTLGYSYKGFGAKWTLSGKGNVYKYKLNRASGPNTKFSVGNAFGLSYTLGKFTLATSFSNTNHWSYSDLRKQDTFSMGQSLTFAPNKKISITVGHSNGGTTYRHNGTDPNVDIFNGKSSTVYTALGYNL